MQIEDWIELVLEINKMVLKFLCRKTVETKLGEIKEVVLNFNTNFDKRTKAGLPSCWDQQGKLLPWETYETLLVEAKCKIGTSHEKTTVLKGATTVNYLHRDFPRLWLIRTLLLRSQLTVEFTNFRMTHTSFVKSQNSDVTV